MSYQPIENYGIIGNMRTVALVGMNGSMDWYCSPHFDSPSIFGGSWMIKKEAVSESPPTLMACRTSSFIGLPRMYWLHASYWQTELPNWKTSCRWGYPLTRLRIAMYTAAFAASGERCAFRSLAAQLSIMDGRRTGR